MQFKLLHFTAYKQTLLRPKDQDQYCVEHPSQSQCRHFWKVKRHNKIWTGILV